MRNGEMGSRCPQRLKRVHLAFQSRCQPQRHRYAPLCCSSEAEKQQICQKPQIIQRGVYFVCFCVCTNIYSFIHSHTFCISVQLLVNLIWQQISNQVEKPNEYSLHSAHSVRCAVCVRNVHKCKTNRSIDVCCSYPIDRFTVVTLITTANLCSGINTNWMNMQSNN